MAAVDAGVSAYVVVGLAKQRIKPILDLAVRFFFLQRFSQDDPWAAGAGGAERENHAPMATFQPANVDQGREMA